MSFSHELQSLIADILGDGIFKKDADNIYHSYLSC